MQIGEDVERVIRSQFPATRGKNDYEIRIVPGNCSPRARQTAGWTEWKNGRARRYHRAQYWIEVGSDYLRIAWPASCAQAALLQSPISLVMADFGKPKNQSLDPEEDELLYA